MAEPSRGEIWMIDLNPTRGHEQSGIRPGLVISVDRFNHGSAGLVVVLPITTKSKGIPLHVSITPPEGGLKLKSFVKCEEVRAISKERFSQRLGKISVGSMHSIEDRLRILLNL